MPRPVERPVHRILLVDDDPDMHEIVSMALGVVGGYHVDICVSGEEAIRRVPRAAPDLILLDVMMPGQDGLETLRLLRSQAATSHVPVVMLTAAATEGDRERWIQRGAAGLITKPFDPLGLPAMLERIRRKGRA